MCERDWGGGRGSREGKGRTVASSRERCDEFRNNVQRGDQGLLEITLMVFHENRAVQARGFAFMALARHVRSLSVGRGVTLAATRNVRVATPSGRGAKP